MGWPDAAIFITGIVCFTALICVSVIAGRKAGKSR